MTVPMYEYFVCPKKLAADSDAYNWKMMLVQQKISRWQRCRILVKGEQFYGPHTGTMNRPSR